jgi:hypothetical protein
MHLLCLASLRNLEIYSRDVLVAFDDSFRVNSLHQTNTLMAYYTLYSNALFRVRLFSLNFYICDVKNIVRCLEIYQTVFYII